MVVIFHGQWTNSRPVDSARNLLTHPKFDSDARPNLQNKYGGTNRGSYHDEPSHNHLSKEDGGSKPNRSLAENDTQYSIECAEAIKRKCCQKEAIKVREDHRDSLNELSLKPVRHTGGYMLSFRYYEQQTQGARNLLQMQCLAHSFGMKIVEPFVVKSMFSIPISDISSTGNLSKKFLSLGDLVDMERWNSEASKKFGYSSVASWQDFLLNAPRNVIAHCIRYRNPPNIQVPIPGFNYREGCPSMCYEKFIKSMEYLGAFGFHLVQKTCSNFVDYAGSVTREDFFENVMDKYSSKEVTLIVNEFRGFFGLYRLPVLSECGIIHKKINFSIVPSSRIMSDTHKYSRDVFQGRPYVAVIARIERVILHLHKNVSKCSQEIRGILKDLKSSHGISDTFLAMDVGKFGSSGSMRNNFQPYGELLFKSIYEEQWTFEQWERSFESSASSDNPAYVANLQRTLAASSQCLILFGGGGFQSQARNLYEKLHPDSKSWCIFRVCSK